MEANCQLGAKALALNLAPLSSLCPPISNPTNVPQPHPYSTQLRLGECSHGNSFTACLATGFIFRKNGDGHRMVGVGYVRVGVCQCLSECLCIDGWCGCEYFG